MSEEKTTAVEETVSETPAKETTQDSSNESLIAESKKYRKRAQDAENKIIELQKKFEAQENAELKQKEEYKIVSIELDKTTKNNEFTITSVAPSHDSLPNYGNRSPS